MVILYAVEADGIVIAYTSVYGHTRTAVSLLADKLKSRGCPKVLVYDLARDDMSQAISDAFRYPKLILATTTYNAGIYPFMNDFITRLVEHNYPKPHRRSHRKREAGHLWLQKS